MDGKQLMQSFMNSIRSTFPAEDPHVAKRKEIEGKISKRLIKSGLDPGSRTYRRLLKKELMRVSPAYLKPIHLISPNNSIE